MTTPNQHWNTLFSKKSDPELGWYENEVSQTLKFLDVIPHISEATIFLPGAGTSILVDALLPQCSLLVLNDISDEALKQLEERVGTNEGKVTWLHHDISTPLPDDIPKSDVWIDRAVLHFLLEEKQIDTYFENLRSNLSAEAHVLLAEFSADGAPKCAGLDLHRYSTEEMTGRIGAGFVLLNEEKYTFINPFGEPRPYNYALYKRIQSTI